MHEALACLVMLAFVSPYHLSGQSTAHSSQETKKILTNADVVRMVKAGLAEEIIISVIHGSAANFDTSADALVALKKQAVPDKVIQAMLTRPGGATETGSQPPHPPIKPLSGEDVSNALTAQQKASTTLTSSQHLPENFAEAFERVVQASKTGFETIKGAPMPGEDVTNPTIDENARATTKAYAFKWKTVVLPGATSCMIVQKEISDASPYKLTLPPEYHCQMNVDQEQLIGGVREALGPGWSLAPCGSPQQVAKAPQWSCFCLDNDPRSAQIYKGNGCLARVFIHPAQGGLDLMVASYLEPTARARTAESEEVSAAINRIQGTEHSQLFPNRGGSGGGPITIQNNTQASVSVFSRAARAFN